MAYHGFIPYPGAMSALASEGFMGEMIDRAAEQVETHAEEIASWSAHASPGIARADLARDIDGVYVDVGHATTEPGFYLMFYEFGGERSPARPHLRPAAEKAVNL